MDEDIISCCINVIKSIGSLVLGKGALKYFFFGIFLIIFFLNYCFKSNNEKNMILFKVIVCLGLYISPFLLNVLTGGSVAIRTLFSLCMLNAFVMWRVFIRLNTSKILKLLVIISLAMPISNIFILNKSKINCYQEELKVANEIIELIKVNDFQDKKMVFIGKDNFNDLPKGEMLGRSFFEWDYETPMQCNNRINGFFKAIGYDYENVSNEQMQELLNKTDDLKPWREDKKLYLINDVVVIKLS